MRAGPARRQYGVRLRPDMTPLRTLALLFCVYAAHALPRSACEAEAPLARVESGLLRGARRVADDGTEYASFRGVPYAKQPLGELRFKELEPPEPWDDCLDAINEGPICFQTDILYGKLMQPQGEKDPSNGEKSQCRGQEACLHANIHVPLDCKAGRVAKTRPRLPILVFIHGGGFAFGSGDADLHGPEYLVSKKVIVITFNYRLNVFGFLSLNTTQIPGNAGLRDMVTLLRWVRRNAEAFGGDPDNVTIAGQSAGSVATHLLALSKATKGLFKRAILMSGTATTNFFSPSPFFAQYLANQLQTLLGITSTDPEDIQRQLTELPAEKLCEANSILLDQIGLTTFTPVVESPLPGVETIVDDYPDTLVAKGRNKDIPLLVGYTSDECVTFRNRLETFNITEKIQQNPKIVVPPKILFSTPPDLHMDLAKKIDRAYYNDTTSTTLDNFIQFCTEGFYEYDALKLSEERARVGGAPLYLYQFSYESPSSVIKQEMGPNYKGVGHIEDLTYVFKVNSVVGTPGSIPPKPTDILMKDLMTDFVVNFMTCSKPICDDVHSRWTAGSGYEDIESPAVYQIKKLSPRQREIIQFFDSLSVI
ncbi:unnamed protein product [Chrysodeixis includens]|uniref:Carboxylic ester hydrolase n=1 Tax=Chrysodeixis includens TaxID=689277 RepID=A0A9P0BTI1_CHRIL|nr:unnamed protein product [Chrysodeixis includens]